ncbi:MAG: ABC transporter ATP-binding protein [Gemmatimonadota bacterium]
MQDGQPSTLLVRFRNLHRSYLEGDRTHIVLQGASGDLRAGESVALVGPSGSGKSTLLNLLSGIDPADEGEVEVAGVPLHALSERDRTLFRRRGIGFVFQSYNLLPTLTVEENLLLPLELRGAVTGAGRDLALSLLDQVGLVHRKESYPDRLSGGERQRVAVARALVHEPPLILADEPTGNLDVETGGRVMDLLNSLVQERGATLLTVTHSPEVARRATRIWAIQRGVVVEQPREGC